MIDLDDFDREDDAYERARLRDEKRRAAGYSVELLKLEPPIPPLPKPQACHHCEAKFVGVQCPICKTERPTFTAMKKLSAAR